MLTARVEEKIPPDFCEVDTQKSRRNEKMREFIE